MRPPDRIEVSAGVVHLPEEFRRVARAANEAGLQGYRVKDVSYGIAAAPPGRRRRRLDDHELLMGQELREGTACVKELISLLPELRAVVLVGKRAAEAERYLKTTGLPLLASDHPSPLVRAKFPQRWNAIPLEWAKVRRFLKAD